MFTHFHNLLDLEQYCDQNRLAVYDCFNKLKTIIPADDSDSIEEYQITLSIVIAAHMVTNTQEITIPIELDTENEQEQELISELATILVAMYHLQSLERKGMAKYLGNNQYQVTDKGQEYLLNHAANQ